MPFITQNQSVISPKFVKIIFESCSLIDSVFKYSMPPDKRYTLKDYSQYFEQYFELENSITIFLDQPIRFINPFKEWTSRIPKWWQAYNKLKHDRLSNLEVATYENTVLSLAALHQVISRDRNFIPTLLSAGWFNPDSEDFGELAAARIGEVGIPIHVIPVESKLFVSPNHHNFVNTTDSEPVIDDCDFSIRTKNIILIYEYFEGNTTTILTG